MERVKIMHRSRIKMLNNHHKQQRVSHSEQDKEMDQNLNEKFLTFLTRTKLQRLKQKLLNYYGRNFAIEYDNKYNFLQQWQQHHNKQQVTMYDLLQSESIIVQTLCLIIMIINAMLVWAITVDRIFRNQGQESNFQLFTIQIGAASRVVSMILNANLQFKRRGTHNWRNICRIILRDSICLAYFLIGLTQAYQQQIFTVVEIFICLHLFLQSRAYYKSVRVIELALVYQYQFKILDLMLNILIIAHFLSLLLFLSTKANSQINWIISLGINEQYYMTKYIYSIYFCCTTILTIGYGDITPKNRTEVLIIMMVQFLGMIHTIKGVIIFGYLISEIGHTLSTIRTKEERLEKDMITLNKMQNYYGLDRRLINRTKGYLMANQNTITQLTPEQENNLLSKLNQQLRNVIISDKSLAIVKTSVFFLCRWSKEMQTCVANHLQKTLYAPKERILQPAGQERIYIIKQGKIDIYLDRFGENKKEHRRLLKTIHATEPLTISDNIYGYTAVISDRSCALNAQASQFTSCYFIQREDFLRCVRSSNKDFEYYHQIRTRIDQSEFCQAFQVPSILNIREHYNPSKAIIIRKELAMLRKMKNKREYHIRKDKHKFSKHYFKNMIEILEKISDKIIENTMTELFRDQRQVEEETIEVNNKSSTIVSTSQQLCMQPSLQSNQNKLISSSSARRIKRRLATLPRGLDMYVIDELQTAARISIKTFHHLFEKAREYKNFFCKNNMSEVIKRLEFQHYNSKYSKSIVLNVKMYSPRSITHFFQGYSQ